MSKDFFHLSFRPTGEIFDPAVQDFSLSLEMTRLQADFRQQTSEVSLSHYLRNLVISKSLPRMNMRGAIATEKSLTPQ
jgi:hypothetical protein